MRCSCHVCDTYMVHSESLALGCVCPACGYRCQACLGTDSVLSRDALRRLKEDPGLTQTFLSALDNDAEEPSQPLPPDPEEDPWLD